MRTFAIVSIVIVAWLAAGFLFALWFGHRIRPPEPACETEPGSDAAAPRPAPPVSAAPEDTVAGHRHAG